MYRLLIGMASSGNVTSDLGEGDSIGARVSARKRSRTAAAKKFSISGEGESSVSNRRSASKRVEAAAAEGSDDLTVLSAAKCKSGTQDAKNNSELDVNIWSQLHEHQQATIIAKLPFKELFQAMSLSKTWRLRFHSDPIFQRDVRSLAASWKPYAPLYVIGAKGLLVGYQRSSQSWHQLQTHTYFPKAAILQWYLRAVDGPLFCWVGEDQTRVKRSIFVANPLTKSWKRLPPQPNSTRIMQYVHVIREEHQAYKVLLCSTIVDYDENFKNSKINIDIQIFNSTNGSWTVESYSTDEEGGVELPDCQDGGSAIIEGVLYMLFSYWKNSACFMLLPLDLKKKVFKETILLQRELLGLSPPNLPDDGFSQLVVCGLNLMLVIREPDLMLDDDRDHNLRLRIASKGTLTIFRFDLERLMIIKVSQAPTEMLDGGFGELLTVAACDGDVIYIGNDRPLRASLCYNLGTEQWQEFNSAPDILSVGGGEWWDWDWKTVTYAYQPGLDPFLKV